MARRRSTGNQPAKKTDETPKQTPAKPSGRKVRTNRRGEPKRDRRERFN